MRQMLLVAVVIAAGCAAQGLPIESGSGNGAGPGGQSTSDLSKPLGDVGATCQSACDCMAGLACRNGMCGMSQFGQIYCCDSNNCPSGNFCQSSNGGFSQCGMGGTGGFGGGNPPPFFGDMTTNPFPFDGGAGSFCRGIKCGQDSDCIAAGCMMCSRRGTCR